MKEYIPEITFEEARGIAEKSARRRLEPFMGNASIPILRNYYEEAECCWFFFKNPQIVGSIERNLSWNFAIAVSKKGEVSIIADFSDEQEKLKDYLQVMSNYFKERGL